MNERITELVVEARNYALDEKRIYERVHNTEQCMEEYREVYNKKFAELIVRDTLDQVNEFSRLTKAYQKEGIDPEFDVTKEILKNFGFTRFPIGDEL